MFEFNFLFFVIDMCRGPMWPCLEATFEPIYVVSSKASSMNLCIVGTDLCYLFICIYLVYKFKLYPTRRRHNGPPPALESGGEYIALYMEKQVRQSQSSTNETMKWRFKELHV